MISRSTTSNLYQTMKKQDVLPLNLLDFFTDLEIFITNLEKLLEQKLTQQALEFISAKQKANLAIFNKHEQSITGNTATEDILDCFRIAMHIDYDVAKYSSFLKNPTQYLSSIPIEDKQKHNTSTTGDLKNGFRMDT